MSELARLAQRCAVASSLFFLPKGARTGGVSCSAKDIQAEQSAARSSQRKYPMGLWLVDCGVRWRFEMVAVKAILTERSSTRDRREFAAEHQCWGRDKMNKG